jgi:pimeloyl-ACP methyl ester carboxylesterase
METAIPFIGLFLVAVVIFLAYWRISRRARVLNTPYDFATQPPAKGRTTGFVEIPEFKIYYEQAGRGKDVVLLHGIGASSYTWRHLLPLLSQKYRVTSIDLPGFGRSTKNTKVSYGLDAQAARVAEIFSSLQIRRAHIVGSSMGGAIALGFARNHPDKTDHLALIAPAATQGIVHFDYFRASRVGALVTPFIGPRIGRQILNLVFHDRSLITKEVIDRYMEPYTTDPKSIITFIKAIEALRDARLPVDLSLIQCPIAILYGEKDMVIRKRHIEKIRASFSRQPRYFSHPSLGHHPMEENPAWVNECLQSFF